MSAFDSWEMALLDAAAPIDVMKFTLTYEGPLGSNSVKQKWALRKAFHPQLQELWGVSAALGRVKHIMIPGAGGSYATREEHHSAEPAPTAAHPPKEQFTTHAGSSYRYLCHQIERHGVWYVPLVRESMALICGLDILFLRKEPPGALIKQGGDIDNRIKTLFDGLRMPSNGDQPYAGDNLPEPLYCLLEEDALISQVNVDTGRLLTRPDGNADEVKLVITVTVKAAHVRVYNLPLLGD